MMRGRVAYAGAIHEAYPHPQGVLLADGRVCREDQVVWLPPIRSRHHLRARPELRRPREGALQFNSAGRAAGFPEGPGHAFSATAA